MAPGTFSLSQWLTVVKARMSLRADHRNPDRALQLVAQSQLPSGHGPHESSCPRWVSNAFELTQSVLNASPGPLTLWQTKFFPLPHGESQAWAKAVLGVADCQITAAIATTEQKTNIIKILFFIRFS